ncbi:DUF4352 domain-containing protein [Streptomonospora salina]|uniref:DUF4352 domain-containing protein n=1 Tax=Streptomonospora salina TaxID=104205 RepID=A0A841EBK1_9ACTN|nr:DUF4352 domain-containing protein [Streptomonospora salina]MBB5999804.1 hypothetical protein [Streptomonospora salina]
MNEQQPPPAAPPQKKGKGWLFGCLGCGGLAVLVLVIVLAVVLAGGGSEDSGDGSGDGGGSGNGGDGGGSAAGIGETVESGAFAFTVTEVEDGVTELSDDTGVMTETPQGQYVIVHVTVENVGDESGTFDASGQKLFDGDGNEYSADSQAPIMTGDQNAFLNEINPGNTVEGRIAFDIPTDVQPTRIELSSFLSIDEPAVVNLT